MPSLLLRSTAVAAVALCLAGCGGGSGTVPVRGTVTFKGKPVPSGTITFIPDAGPHATGEIGPDGTYTLTTYKAGDGAVPGSYKVVVVAMQDTSARLPEERTPLPPPIVPTKYTSVATTDLTAQVKDGENTINFDLKGEVTK
jgi:hypothetical protein